MSESYLTISHVGLFAQDLRAMVDFYTDVYGFKITDQRVEEQPDGSWRGIVFMSANPADHHQFFLMSGRETEPGQKHFGHSAFRLTDLEHLRGIWSRAQARSDLQDSRACTHGNAWSIYLRDFEGNLTEAFVDTPWHIDQPFEEPIDLTTSVEAITAETARLIEGNPSKRPLAEWQSEFADAFSRR